MYCFFVYYCDRKILNALSKGKYRNRQFSIHPLKLKRSRSGVGFSVGKALSGAWYSLNVPRFFLFNLY